MPKDPSIQKVLVIGSGPIVIGQAAEFDYAGTQACRVLKQEGVETVLVNSNPATIMTDNAMADAIYLEPLTTETIKRIILETKPDSLLAGLGGQTGLTIAMELDHEGFLKEHNVRLIGTNAEAIDKAEDRQLFKDAMAKIGELQREYLALQERMKAGQKELEEFISSARAVCARQMAYLDELPRLSVEDQLPPEEPAAPEPAAEIEENLFSSFARESEVRQPEAETTAEPEPQPEPEPEEDPAEEDDYPEGNPFEPEDNEPTRRINLSQLKFGRNYTGRDDD